MNHSVIQKILEIITVLFYIPQYAMVSRMDTLRLLFPETKEILKIPFVSLVVICCISLCSGIWLITHGLKIRKETYWLLCFIVLDSFMCMAWGTILFFR